MDLVYNLVPKQEHMENHFTFGTDWNRQPSTNWLVLTCHSRIFRSWVNLVYASCPLKKFWVFHLMAHLHEKGMDPSGWEDVVPYSLNKSHPLPGDMMSNIVVVTAKQCDPSQPSNLSSVNEWMVFHSNDRYKTNNLIFASWKKVHIHPFFME